MGGYPDKWEDISTAGNTIPYAYSHVQIWLHCSAQSALLCMLCIKKHLPPLPSKQRRDTNSISSSNMMNWRPGSEPVPSGCLLAFSHLKSPQFLDLARCSKCRRTASSFLCGSPSSYSRNILSSSFHLLSYVSIALLGSHCTCFPRQIPYIKKCPWSCFLSSWAFSKHYEWWCKPFQRIWA